MAAHSTIAGVGASLPAKRVGNDHFAGYLDTSEEWIVARTGIKARHFAAPGELVSDLAVPAAAQALDRAGLAPEQVELIVFATTTPDRFMPATACLLQSALGAGTCPAFDIQAVCTGFVYGLSVADAMIRAGGYNNALVVGADMYSRVLDFQDRSTCILFGDGAGAAVLTRSEKAGLASFKLAADGSEADLITASGHLSGNELRGSGQFAMNGPRVFKAAIEAMEQASRAVCEQAGIAPEQVSWLVAHQANLRIVDSLAGRLAIPDAGVVRTVTEHANTSAASVPLGLASIWDDIKPGDWVLMTAVGGGLTWGAALWQA